jgi:hypothetical protein
MKAGNTEPLSYSLMDIVIPEANSCKYLVIIFHIDLNLTYLITL